MPFGNCPRELQPDFSATTDLYSIVANVEKIRYFPVGLRPIYELLAVMSLPFVPIVFAAVPFDVLVKEITKLLL